MNNLTSDNLQDAQKVLETVVKNEIDSPQTDYKKVKKYLSIIAEIDLQRRELWHNEKFGVYEQIVDETFSSFNSDDIPF